MFERKSVLFSGVVFLLALLLWGLIYFSIKARYDHFSGFEIAENISLPTTPVENNDKLLNHSNEELNQLGRPGFFWSEAAFHYRTTLMYAVDWYQNSSVLNEDQWQEYPDGVNAWSEYSIFMEPVFGFLYKWIFGKSQNLIQFLMIILPAFHVLLLFPIFYLAKILSRSFRYALLSVVVFSTCSLTFSPLLDSFYVKETFSWFLFSVFFIGHFSYLHEKKKRWLWVGGIGLFLFLVSWHLAQFLTIPVLFVGAWCLVWDPQGAHITGNVPTKAARKWEGARSSFLQPAIYFLVFFAAGFSPSLKAREFHLGLPLLIAGAGLILTLIFSFFPSVSETKKKRLLWTMGCLGAAFCIALFNSRFIDDYSHVSGLLWHRVINGFQKPANPTEIPFDVRVFWVPPFSSPRWVALKAGLSANGILLLFATIWTMTKSFRNETKVFEKSIIWCSGCFLLAFILVERLAPAFIFFAAITVSLLGIYLEKAMIGKAGRKFVFPVLLVFPAFSLFYSMGGMVQLSAAAIQGENPTPPGLDTEWDSARSSLFQWIRKMTPGPDSSIPGECSSFVGEIGMSPQLLLYTGRPVVLNSQFENKNIRSRYYEYLTALFSEKESDLVEFFKKYQIDYIFINRDWATANGRNAPKYLAGNTGLSSLKSNISQLHFFPSELQNFQPVYENNIYRVFKFCEGSDGGAEAWSRTYNKWWNLANFSSSEGYLLDSKNDRRELQDIDNMFRHILQKLGRIYHSFEQSWYVNHSEPRVSLNGLQRKLAYSRFAVATEGHSASSTKSINELEMEINNRLDEINQESGLTLRNELLNILNGDAVGFRGALKKIFPVECSPDEYSIIGEILVLLGEFEIAGEFFGKGGAVFPKPALTTKSDGLRPSEVQERLWEETVLYLIAGGKTAKGRGLARFCATHVSPGSARQEFFVKAGNINLDK